MSPPAPVPPGRIRSRPATTPGPPSRPETPGPPPRPAPPGRTPPAGGRRASVDGGRAWRKYPSWGQQEGGSARRDLASGRKVEPCNWSAGSWWVRCWCRPWPGWRAAPAATTAPSGGSHSTTSSTSFTPIAVTGGGWPAST